MWNSKEMELERKACALRCCVNVQDEKIYPLRFLFHESKYDVKITLENSNAFLCYLGNNSKKEYLLLDTTLSKVCILIGFHQAQEIFNQHTSTILKTPSIAETSSTPWLREDR